MRSYFFLIVPFLEICQLTNYTLTHDNAIILTSPNHPDPYPSGLTCNALIGVKEGGRPIVTFLDFDMEKNYDFVSIGIGNVSDGNGVLLR